jgi:acyl-CoA thioesterase-2
VPPPESLTNELEIVRAHAAEIPESLRGVLTQDRPIDFRPVTPADPFARNPKAEPRRIIWFRLLHEIPDAPILHQAVLAYASDYGFLPTSLFPHGVAFRDPRLMIASLDHTLWMHRPFRADEWLLYVCDSPAAYGARGFVRGEVFTRDGTLVATVAQEGLIRLKDRK